MKTVADFKKMKQQGESIVMLTAYDYPTAQLAEQAGVDILLVGDSLGMVVLGYEATNVVTIEDMIHHGKAVKRGAPQSFIVVDMPFGSYHGSDDRALQKAIRLFQETGASALKLEGAGKVIDKIELLTSVGIPIVAHLGLLPQSASVIGGYKVQGKTAAAAEQLIADAQACEAAGARMLVVECIPHQLTEQLRSCLSIPVIGIGAGRADGQVLVFHDVVQYGMHHIPKFVKSYANVHTLMIEGISQYVKEVKDHVFPTASHQFTMAEEEVTKLLEGDK